MGYLFIGLGLLIGVPLLLLLLMIISFCKTTPQEGEQIVYDVGYSRGTWRERQKIKSWQRQEELQRIEAERREIETAKRARNAVLWGIAGKIIKRL
jgi:hypothetical protein